MEDIKLLTDYIGIDIKADFYNIVILNFEEYDMVSTKSSTMLDELEEKKYLVQDIVIQSHLFQYFLCIYLQ